MRKQDRGIPQSVLGDWIRAGQRAWLQPRGAPSWDASALFREDKAGPRPSRDTQEQGLTRIKNRTGILDVT